MLANCASIHTYRWATSLSVLGVEIGIFSFIPDLENLYHDYPDIKIYCYKIEKEIFQRGDGSLHKLRYIYSFRNLKKIITEFKPDIVHAHYLSSYGFLGSLINFHPFVVSVWGSDIFVFPNKSIIHKAITKYVLNKADTILSTSNCMAVETKKYTSKDIIITPFGIDINIFKPKQVQTIFNENEIVIGTIKTLDPRYGIQYLLKAFKIVVDKFPDYNLKLLIVGGGHYENDLRDLAAKLDIFNKVIFTGKVKHNLVSNYYNMIDIFVALSEYESFGVAVLEASACSKPVIVSNVGGLPEIVIANTTGIIVPPKNEFEAAIAIEELIKNKSKRELFGRNGREMVLNSFVWDKNVEQMYNIYSKVKYDIIK